MREFTPIPGLTEHPIPPETADIDVPHYIESFIRDADDAALEFEHQTGLENFVQSDYRYAFQVLCWLLRTQKAVKGAPFLEWGSGQGMVSILASLLGYAATGVELHPALIREAKRLSSRFEVNVRWIHGSFRQNPPATFVSAEGFRIVYVYPWPGEEAYFHNLFAATAPENAYLLFYLGPEDIRLFQKTSIP